MKINLDYIFKTLDGKPIINIERVDDDDETKKTKFTMKTACVNALTVSFPNEKIEGEEKVRRAILAEKIYQAKNETDINIDDISLLKKLIGVMGSPLIVKQAWEILDPQTKN